ncbi:hypothetical protein [Polaribacter glomeratus]|uniref:Uncharacterized protein n=1 Tax=Polaribacter glomeratus TaxID=102 RepID=A0A2S7WUP7_9FLAO|nr:hypothetical protein [Polaribacter glomeratus]PQJ81298.1 hypothetical protein BTO16_01315 [Polaribacter glomeratus]TXD64088.1 hypothetical protein ESX12_16665 [Polaribacter glomeratus]
MKNIILILIILISLKSFGQKNNADKYQKEWFEKAKIEIEKPDLAGALIKFYWAYENNKESELGKVCLKKIDSLKPLVRKEKINELKGNWKLVNNESKEEHFLKISETEIRFYEKKNGNSEIKLVKTEKILFNEINYGSYPTYWELIFSDNQIWNFNVNDKIDENILYTSKTNKVGDYSIKHYPMYKDGRKPRDKRNFYERIK